MASISTSSTYMERMYMEEEEVLLESTAQTRIYSSAARTLGRDKAVSIFEKIDVNGNGEISRSEFIKALRKDLALASDLGLPSKFRQEDEDRDLFSHAISEIDTDESKTISIQEFLTYYTPEGEHVEEGAKWSQPEMSAEEVKAKALKRALTQLSSIRNMVPGYKELHSHVLATMRSLTTQDDDISAADSESALGSPAHGPRSPRSPMSRRNSLVQQMGAQEVAQSSADVIPRMHEKYYQEEKEAEAQLLLVPALRALMSNIGGFCLNGSLSKNVVKRRRKVKKEAAPQTPEQAQRLDKIESATAIVLKSVHDQLWNRWGEASQAQKDALAKHIRRGLRIHDEAKYSAQLPFDISDILRGPLLTTSAQNKLVTYMCQLGSDWESMLAAAKLTPKNMHEWSDEDWLKKASKQTTDDPTHSEESDQRESSDSGESIWEEVEETADEEGGDRASLRYLQKRRLLRRLVAAYHSGECLIKVLDDKDDLNLSISIAIQ